jgi:hypothetical protein
MMRKIVFCLVMLLSLFSIANAKPVTWSDALAKIGEQFEPPIVFKTQQDFVDLLAKNDNSFWDGYDFISPKGLTEVRSCDAFFRVRREKLPFAVLDESDFRGVADYLTHTLVCEEVKAVAEAKPSHKTFVSDFRFTKKTVLNLPASISFELTTDLFLDDEKAKLLKGSKKTNESVTQAALAKAKTLGNYRKGKVRIISPTQAEYETEDGVQFFSIDALGDFTNDGIEDVLLSVVNTARPEGRYLDYRLYVLSKLSAQGELKVAKTLMGQEVVAEYLKAVEVGNAQMNQTVKTAFPLASAKYNDFASFPKEVKFFLEEAEPCLKKQPCPATKERFQYIKNVYEDEPGIDAAMKQVEPFFSQMK